MRSERVIPTRSRIRASKSRARDAVLRQIGPDLIEHILTFVDETCDARAACVASDWAQTGRAWSLERRDLDIKLIAIPGAPNELIIAVVGDTVEYAERGPSDSEDGVVAMHDIATCGLLWEKRLQETVEDLDFTPDGSQVALGFAHLEEIILLDSASGEIRRRLSHSGTKLIFSDVALAAANGTNHSIVLIDWASGEERCVIQRDSYVGSMQFVGAEDSMLIVCDESNEGDKITAYDVATGKELRELNMRGVFDEPTYTNSVVAFAPHGLLFAEYRGVYATTLDHDNNLREETLAVRDALTGEVKWETGSFFCASRATPICGFSGDGSTLLGPSSDLSAIAFYDIATGALRRTLQLAYAEPGATCFSQNDSRLFLAGGKLGDVHYRITQHDVKTGELLRKAR